MKQRTNRIEYVDRLRGLAVVAMYFVHSAGSWLETPFRDGRYYKWAMTVSGYVAPTFMFLAGVSVCLIAQRGSKSAVEPSILRWSIARRGVKILLLGYALHFCFWAADGFQSHWTRILKVDILHCIGLGLALFPFLAWPKNRVNWEALLLFLGIPILGHVIYWIPSIDQLPVGLTSYFSTKTRLALFPFVPYSAWIAMGLFVGPFWVKSLEEPEKEKRFWMIVLLSALLLFALAKGAKHIYYAGGLDWFGAPGDKPMTRGVFHVFLSKAVIVLVLFYLSWVSRNLFLRPKTQILTLFGKASLFAYAVHLFFVYHTVGRYLGGALSPHRHVLAAVALALWMYLLSWLWRRFPPSTILDAVKNMSGFVAKR